MKLVILFLGLLYSFASFAQDTIIDERTGVKLIFSADGEIFPDTWYSEEINAKAISLDSNEYKRSEKIIKSALVKYPIELIQNNIKNIFILKDIEFYGQSFGGTNSTLNLYISNDGIKNGYTNLFIEQTLHHEFSSILLRNFNDIFQKTEWINCNPSDFTYGGGGLQALKENKDSEDLDTRFNKLGFINEYATSSLENDFNEFAQNLFSPHTGFNQVVERYALIRKKRQLIIEFYTKLNDSLTEEYFNKSIFHKKHYQKSKQISSNIPIPFF